jgi:hypothetical protein
MAWKIEIALIVVKLFLACCCVAKAELPAGTVLVSRNANEAENETPGHWNHLAIIVSPTELIESQEGKGVIRTPLAEYLSRPYAQPIQALLPCDRAVGERAATTAATFVGQPYSKLGSILRGPARRMSRGEKIAANCVVPIKAAYWQADRRIRRVWFPDHIVNRDFAGLFDKARPLAELLEQPAIPPTEHSVLSHRQNVDNCRATPRTYKNWDGTRLVNLGQDCFIESNVYDKYPRWKPFVWRETGEQ